MNAEEYVENVREEVSEICNYYFENLPNPLKGTDKNWIAIKKLYDSLNEEQKTQLKIFIKIAMKDVVSTIFSKLDNVSSYANQEGCFELRLDGKVISGDLQEYFFMNEEE